VTSQTVIDMSLDLQNKWKKENKAAMTYDLRRATYDLLIEGLVASLLSQPASSKLAPTTVVLTGWLCTACNLNW